jgi:hypothetical protein
VLNYFNKTNAMLTRKMAICAALVGITVFTFASMGGGKKSKGKKLTASYVPVRTSQGFTLKSGPTYRGSLILSEQKERNYIAFNSLVTYQNGNTTYILPNKFKVQTSSCQNQMKSNLQLLNLKIKLGK